jgi:hypothetical protein
MANCRGVSTSIIELLGSDGQTLKLFPELDDSGNLSQHKVNILIVADGYVNFGGFGDNFFSLSILVDVLKKSSGLPMQFCITQAYRGKTNEPGVKSGFKFSAKELKKYNEVWLFGNNPGPEGRLDKAELRALFDFMNCGNGVFATGDHDDLGAALCGEVPRVRSMRRWAKPDQPYFESPLRLDTLRKGEDNFYQFSDEFDNAPQELFLIMRSDPPTTISCPKAYAHRILCGAKGEIKYLPDHRHEGECLEPTCLTETFDFGAGKLPEYPTRYGHQEVPKVIARARVFEPHTTDNQSECFPVTQRDSFGAIAAYDGQQVEVGRVVVDSSFHHFIFMNVAGFRKASQIPGSIGDRVYEQITNYFRNIATWLAPSTMQDDMRNRTLWAACWAYPLNEALLSVGKKVLEAKEWRSILHVGAAARSTLAGMGFDCEALHWTSDLIKIMGGSNQIALPDPWLQQARPELDITAWIGTEILTKAVLGGAVLQIADQYPIESFFNRSAEGVIKIKKAELEGAIKRGAEKGLMAVQSYLQDFSKSMERALRNL